MARGRKKQSDYDDGLKPKSHKKKVEIINPSGENICPDWLDEYGVIEWNRIIKILSDANLLSGLDTAILASYCLAWSVLKSCRDEIERCGGMAEYLKNIPINKQSALKQMNQSLKTISELSSKLGLSPADRGKLKPVKEKEDQEKGISEFF